MNFKDLAQEIEAQLIIWRRDLHRFPELGLETPQTAAYIAQRLTEMGIEPRTKVGVSGLVGQIRGEKSSGEKPAKTIALRSDMDGLAIVEETGLSFAAKNGNMHACGHDAHMAMLLGAAKLLQANRSCFQGNVRLIFQPAEEGPGGASLMIKEGALDGVDAILGVHIGMISKELQTGQVGIHYGNMMASLDDFKIKVIGKGCHGAMPDTGTDPIVMSAQIINALQTIVSREIRPTHPAVISIGVIRGGRAFNIIPDEVEMIGTVRALRSEVRERIAKRMEEIVAGVTSTMGGCYEYEYTRGYPSLVNNADFTRSFKATAERVAGPENVVEMTEPSMGGEDMAHYLEKVPGTYFLLGAGNPAKNIIYPHHSSRFDVDEDVLYLGSALLAQGAFEYLDEAGLYRGVSF